MAATVHLCNHLCCVTHQFGNLFKCNTSGLLHVCDANCDQRLFHDRYSTICRVSKRIFPPFETDDFDEASRKRGGEEAAQGGGRAKRQLSSGGAVDASMGLEWG